MFWYVVLAILILAGVTLVESFLIVCDVCYQFLYKRGQ